MKVSTDSSPKFMPPRTDRKLVDAKVKSWALYCRVVGSWPGGSHLARPLYSSSARTNDSCAKALNLYCRPSDAVNGAAGWPPPVSLLWPAIASPEATIGVCCAEENLESWV